MSDMLRLCPFCNGEASLTEHDSYDNSPITFWVGCLACHINIGFTELKSEAIAAWNTRHKEENTLTLDEIRAVVFKFINNNCERNTRNYGERKTLCTEENICAEKANDCRECLMQEFKKKAINKEGGK